MPQVKKIGTHLQYEARRVMPAPVQREGETDPRKGEYQVKIGAVSLPLQPQGEFRREFSPVSHSDAKELANVVGEA